MAQRITIRDLEGVVNRLNRITNNPLTPWRTNANGKLRANIGNYHIDWAYGGCTLHQMQNEAGGVRDVVSIGYTSKKDLYHAIHAYISGISSNIQ